MSPTPEKPLPKPNIPEGIPIDLIFAYQQLSANEQYLLMLLDRFKKEMVQYELFMGMRQLITRPDFDEMLINLEDKHMITHVVNQNGNTVYSLAWWSDLEETV